MPVYQGDDLLATVKVSLVEALCGYELHLKGIDGKEITKSIPKIAPTTVISVVGEGMPRKIGGRGNLKIAFEIAFPTTPLTEKQRGELKNILK